MRRILPALFPVVLAAVAARAAEFRHTDLLYENKFDSVADLEGWQTGPERNFKPGEGLDGSGALYFKGAHDRTDWIAIGLDPAKIRGLIKIEALVKGRGLERGKRAYWGAKVMLQCTRADGRVSHPEPDGARQYGSYDWKTVEKVVELPADTTDLKLFLGIQNAPGEFWVDRVAVWNCVESDAVRPPPSTPDPEASAIARGPGAGTKYRGVMSGDDLSAAAFEELSRWNVNLMRLQMGVARGRDVSTPEAYLAWIDEQAERIDSVLPLAEKHGIKLVIDLHRGPGTKVNEVGSNLLTPDTNLELFDEVWRRLAARFKGNPNIYGYDLLNEPGDGKLERFIPGAPPWQTVAERLVKVIRAVDPDTPIIVEPPAWLDDFTGMTPIRAKNILYSPHFYNPQGYTHQGVHGKWLKWSYPGWIDGVWWDKERIRVAMKSAIDFQREHGVAIFVGEFSVVPWAEGAERYLADTIELMEEYGWDWTYHAFRESPYWSVEHTAEVPAAFVPSEDNPRKRVLLDGLRRNAVHRKPAGESE